MFFYYWYYLLGFLLLPGIIMSINAQVKVSRAFNENNQKTIRSGITANKLARYLLDGAGLYDVEITRCNGNLTDHYDPKKKVVSLSDTVYNNNSISALGVMAHEIGHVLQYRDNYGLIKLRTFLIPIINISNYFMWPLTILGIVLEFMAYTKVGFVFICIGVGIFALSTIFSLITLPIEKNASKRAYTLLVETNIMTEEEGKGVKEVLNAASQTYLAGLVTSILSLLRFVLFIATVRRRDD